MKIPCGSTIALGIVVTFHCDVTLGKPGEDLCNFAKIESATSGQEVAVHTGPGVNYRKIDALKVGAIVYICDSTGSWYEVFYGSGNDSCSSPVEEGLPAKDARSCKSGWVSKKKINIRSG